MTIRKAEKRDCKQLLKLIKELAAYEKFPDAVKVSLAHFEESGFGDNPVWWGFVATSHTTLLPNATFDIVEEEIVGLAIYYIRFSTWLGQRMYLEDLVVSEKARGMGTGKLLFDALIIEAKEKKLSGIAWQVLDWNEPAINFYKKYYNAKFDGEWINCSIEMDG